MTDEERLSQYLDGRLEPGARAAFESRLGAEPALARRLRVLAALKGALRDAAEPAPAALRARLKAAARAALPAPAPLWRRLLREALSPEPWNLAAASAFAAAALMVALHRERGPDPVAPPAGVSAPAWTASAEYQALGRELWSEDEGGDDDAI